MPTMARVLKLNAMSRTAFEVGLATWSQSAGWRETIGDALRGQTAWIHVRSLGGLYFLNSDTSKEGVAAYLKMLAVDPQLEWAVVANRLGRANKVAFGRELAIIPKFYFYKAEA